LGYERPSPLIPRHVIETKYSGDKLPGMQIFASHHFPRTYVNQFRGQNAFSDAEPMPDDLTSGKLLDDGLQTRRIPQPTNAQMLAFSIPPVHATYKATQPFIYCKL
jgi:hypothetical protein